MKKGMVLSTLSFLVLLSFFACLSEAEIPSTLNYQGYLTDAAGNPVDGVHKMVFSIYDMSSGGAALWQETRWVTVTNGRFSKNLGASTPIELAEAKPYYLGIAVDDDPEMTPREALASSMYSFFAKHLDGIAVVEGRMGIGTTNPKRELHLKALPGNHDVYFGFTNGDGDYCEIGYDGDSDGMEFRTQGYETRMFLGDNDLIGIGTKTPLERLDVRGAIMIGDTTTEHAGTLRFHSGNFEGYTGNEWKSLTEGGTGSTLWTQQGNDLSYTIGQVGIGTASPARTLHLQAPAGEQDAYMRFTNGNGKFADIGYDGNTSGLEFRPQGVPKLFVGDSGKVGIGMTAPTHTLTVNGAIRAKEVLVDNNNWPDFVFDQDYSLMPLSQVEHYISAEKHLPGIPSAEEVAADGVSVGEMQSKMLQKLEELTLHLITLEKENSRLKDRVSSLEQLLDHQN